MNNAKMVSFPRELSDDLAELIAARARVCGGGALEIWEAICDEFGKPAAEQRQGEPVGTLLIGEIFDSHEVGEVDVQLDSKACEQLAEKYPGQTLTLYTHADLNDRSKALAGEQMQVISGLRAQLAEQAALLREALPALDLAATAFKSVKPVRAKIRAALSTIVEPDSQAARGDLPAFASKVISKLKRFRDCAEDGQDVDIGRQWFDTLVQLGLLHRVQRSPARWEITDEGDALLEAQVFQEKK